MQIRCIGQYAGVELEMHTPENGYGCLSLCMDQSPLAGRFRFLWGFFSVGFLVFFFNLFLLDVFFSVFPLSPMGSSGNNTAFVCGRFVVRAGGDDDDEEEEDDEEDVLPGISRDLIDPMPGGNIIPLVVCAIGAPDSFGTRTLSHLSVSLMNCAIVFRMTGTECRSRKR